MIVGLRRSQMRMCDADRESYGGPEWLTIEPEEIYRLPFTELDAIERDWNFSLVQWLEVEIPAYTARAIKGTLYMGLRREGVEVKWKHFNPQTLGIDTRELPEDDDADPPASSGGTTSNSGDGSPAPDAAPSVTSTRSSARGSHASTTSSPRPRKR